jgi:Mor family transcriptional regulator
MKYIKAQNVLPEEVIELIQKYVDGEFIYIPRKDGRQKAWGEKSGIKESLKERNNQIYRKYKDGATVADLSKDCFLSEQSIRRVISQEKVRLSNSLHNHL